MQLSALFILKVITAFTPSSLPLLPSLPSVSVCLRQSLSFLPVFLFAPGAISVPFFFAIQSEYEKQIFNPPSTVLIMTKQRHINISGTHGQTWAQKRHSPETEREKREMSHGPREKWESKLVWVKSAGTDREWLCTGHEEVRREKQTW